MPNPSDHVGAILEVTAIAPPANHRSSPATNFLYLGASEHDDLLVFSFAEYICVYYNSGIAKHSGYLYYTGTTRSSRRHLPGSAMSIACRRD